MKMVQKPRKSLVAFALASAIGGAMLSAPAQAVNLSPDNLGQVHVFPYYTVKNGFDTYIHLTNTSEKTVIAKIRFREAKNSREVRDFNIILSPSDVWTAAVTQSGDGAKLVTFDKSCTSPLLPASSTSPGATEIDFTSLGYDGSDQYTYDNGGLGIDRTQEGYFEVIAMGASDRSTSSLSTGDSATDNIVEFNAKHVGNVPRDCAVVDQQFADQRGIQSGNPAFDHFVFPGNVLKGFSTLINVASGQAVGVEPTVFANFREPTSAHLIYPPGDLSPALDDVEAGARFVNDAGELASFAGTADIDSISALLMRRNVINEFTSTAAGTTQTDWVLTFPTKHYYTDTGGDPELVLTAAVAPFDELFAKDADDLTRHNGKSCVDIGPTYYNREEATRAGASTDFSPRPAGGRVELCNEVNVLSFNNSDVFGSSVRFAINTSAVAETGWMNLRMGPQSWTAGGSTEGILAGTDGAEAPVVMRGLPVIGFGAVVRYNTAEAGNNRNYGVAEEHSYNREVD